MLGITFSPQNYHHHQQFLSKLREINENVMTSAVWAVIVFGPRVWQLSARCHYVLRDYGDKKTIRSHHKVISKSSEAIPESFQSPSKSFRSHPKSIGSHPKSFGSHPKSF